MNRKGKNVREEELFLILASFWITILAIRAICFYFEKRFSIIPEIIFYGFHMPHYFIGFVILLLCAFLYFLPKARENFFYIVFVGIGFALLFDELSMWFNSSGSYWAPENLISIGILGGALFFYYFYVKKTGNLSEEKKMSKIHKNPDSPCISIVIPAYNEEKFLAKTLKSVLSQDYKNFELIVVDNNSSDNTKIIAEKFGAKIVEEKKQGVVFARQKGFLEAKGDIIATTDADTILPNNWTSLIADNFKNNKKLVVYGGLCNLYSGPITAKFSAYYLIYPYRYLDKKISGGWSMAGANFAVRKKAFLKAGGFNISMKSYEDVELSQRMRKLGDALLDPCLRVETSGRRFKHGVLSGIKPYIINEAIRIFEVNKDFVDQPDIRTEKSKWSGIFSFAPMFLLFIFLFSLFYFSNPAISSAEEIKFLKEKASFIAIIIKEGNISDYMAGVKNSRIDKTLKDSDSLKKIFQDLEIKKYF